MRTISSVPRVRKGPDDELVPALQHATEVALAVRRSVRLLRKVDREVPALGVDVPRVVPLEDVCGYEGQ